MLQTEVKQQPQEDTSYSSDNKCVIETLEISILLPISVYFNINNKVDFKSFGLLILIFYFTFHRVIYMQVVVYSQNLVKNIHFSLFIIHY